MTGLRWVRCLDTGGDVVMTHDTDPSHCTAHSNPSHTSLGQTGSASSGTTSSDNTNNDSQSQYEEEQEAHLVLNSEIQSSSNSIEDFLH